MARYDQGGGCACGLRREEECDCPGPKRAGGIFLEPVPPATLTPDGGTITAPGAGEWTLRNPEAWERPWGEFTDLLEGPGYKVKRIEILAGKAISRQFHEYREEHWNFIEGAGIMELGDPPERIAVSKGDYLRVGRKQVHKLINTGTKNLVAIEIQMGEIVSEDDITRLDSY